ncbi:MAG: hypothetical protein MUF15_19280 [Acidobacteria bacterium]|nr:hypothetical protein [Acidobacteriota bacterium]
MSFKEFLQFRGDKKKEPTIEFQNYIRFGGLPALHHFDFIEDVVYQYLKSVYDTILLKDIIKHNNIRNVHLLENINKYLFDNIGNIFSAKRVSDYLKSQKLSVTVDTVQNYIGIFFPLLPLIKCSGMISRANESWKSMKNILPAMSAFAMPFYLIRKQR